MNTLFIGYGNPDRQDDGVAWHVLSGIAKNLGLDVSSSWEEPLPSAPKADFRFELQLTPEMAGDLTAYDRVCFVDAHTGKIPENVQMVDVTPEYQTSPFTHHLTPEMLLSMCSSLYNKAPEAILISVRGYEFGFETKLSPFTASLVSEAVERARGWFESIEANHRFLKMSLVV
ncbi:MAG TPA: hydrogenase maturation protease [Anaerolineales bacterium]|nr:hydrogenase maturation protease [Anaerolineales bacterium]